ncbi:MAG: alpha/beta fold hydrolase [Candidatus Lokiarchaeota archaeon]|nr:alpha/beta fold hydrolase [Candidatus Lokiarchaeota archaeon]
MLSNTHKRIIVIIIDVLFSWYIWEVNISLGNPCYTTAFSRCFLLSITTFLIFYTPFEIYFSFRDLWFDRWPKLYHKDLEVSNIKINVSNGLLSANLVKNQNQAKIKLKNTLVIVCHGFSDTKETLEYFYYPLAYQGYVVLAYDARGTGKSKKAGKRSDFIERIEDFKKIIEWVKNQEEFSNMKISCVGFSIGAITVLSGGFLDRNIEKIIAISSMSHYKQNIPKYNPVVMLSYLMKGVKLFPNDEENEQLSPYLLIQNAKKGLTLEEWEIYSKKVMLIHCINDRVIKFKNFKENKMILESPEKNVLILKKGGHSQKKNECALVGATLNFLNS